MLISSSGKTNGDDVTFSHSKKRGFVRKKKKSNSCTVLCEYLVTGEFSIEVSFLKLIQTFPLSLDSFALGTVIFVVPREYP